MAEYIDREKAIEEFTFADADICQEYADYECEFRFSREAIKQVLGEMPAADVVPVVRCHECKNLIAVKADNGGAIQVCNRTKSPVCFDDFCSRGERR